MTSIIGISVHWKVFKASFKVLLLESHALEHVRSKRKCATKWRFSTHRAQLCFAQKRAQEGLCL